MATHQDWKRRLLPTYNALVHSARWAGRVVEALCRGRLARCTVCGRVSLLILRRDVLARELLRRWEIPDRLVAAFTRKESLECISCGASLRVRRLAEVMLNLYPAGPSRSIAEWVHAPEVQGLRIAEINGITGLTLLLTSHPHHRYSEYQDRESSQVRHEDLTKLTYPNDSFDLVLTSETLEHVPDLNKALAEIHRILIPGGRHIFTIPWRPDVPWTFARATIHDGRIEPLVALIHHPGGNVGYPVFTEIGQDFPEVLAAVGFEVQVEFGPATLDDVAQVIITQKRTDGPYLQPQESG